MIRLSFITNNVIIQEERLTKKLPEMIERLGELEE
jgi:hypothetical protein